MYTIYTYISPSCAWILYNELLEAAEKEWRMVKDGEFTDHILTIIAMANFHQNLYFCSIIPYSFRIDTYTVCVYLSPKFISSISAASSITALHFSLTHIPVPYSLLPIHSVSNIILCTTSLEPRVHFPAKSFIYFYFELYAYKSKFVYAIHMSDDTTIL